jgi:long-subunit fatty acid transport protein
MKKTLFLAAAAILVGIALGGPAYATPESKAAASFLLFEPSARSAALGKAYVAIADDANATYYNPAALVYNSRKDMSFTMYKPIPALASDVFFAYGTYAQPVGGIGNLGFSMSYVSLGKQFRTGAQGEDLGQFQSFDVALVVSYGMKITRKMSSGLTLKFIHEHLSDKGAGQELGKGTGTSFAGDFGIMYRMAERMTLALALRNVGPNMTFIDDRQSDPLPQHVVLGFAYKAYKKGAHSVLLTTDVYKPLVGDGFFSFFSAWKDESAKAQWDAVDFRLGTEYQLSLTDASYVALRGGYSYDKDGKIKTPTFGMGLKYNWMTFDVAYFRATNTPLNNEFRFSGGFHF